jgi:hypothetical protein
LCVLDAVHLEHLGAVNPLARKLAD